LSGRRRHRGPAAFWLYARALAWEFRWTLGLAAGAVLFMAVVLAATPHAALGGKRPGFDLALYGGWMALLGEPVLTPPETWYLTVLDGLYPLLGALLVGEGIVHFGMLMVSRRRGEKEWVKVMASTYRDHVVLCGAGRLGIRVLELLLEQGNDVVVIEKSEDARFLSAARATGVPVLVRDMTDDDALVEAGVPYARCIILATNDDTANLEVAADARRMNPTIRICLRMFDQRVAAKIAAVFGVDSAFSASALAAPAVAAMAMGARVLSTHAIAGEQYVVSELHVEGGSSLVGCSVADVEAAHGVRVIARTADGAAAERGLPATARLAARDTVVVHAPVKSIPELVRRARA
jgi:Trk K+ transport system NAD-binding subunit